MTEGFIETAMGNLRFCFEMQAGAIGFCDLEMMGLFLFLCSLSSLQRL